MDITLRRDAWYGDRLVRYPVPENWNLEIASNAGAPELSPSTMQAAVAAPIGTERLSVLAKDKKDAVIIVEDITRPIACEPIFRLILEELNSAGIRDSDISIIVGNGTHRPMSRHELLLKIGESTCRRVKTLPHNCYDNLVPLGETSGGTTLLINRFVAEASLVIGVGGVYPHGIAGFSGGGKIILPGVAGIESIIKNHSMPGGSYGVVDGNNPRHDMEEGAEITRLAFIVNAVINSDRKICGLFAGDPVKAHRTACEYARTVYRTEIPKRDYDVVILNAYPMDTELFQAAKAMLAVDRVAGQYVLVLVAGCEDGFGYHALCGPGGRSHEKEKLGVIQSLRGRKMMIFSENIELHDVYKKFPQGTELFKNWEELTGGISHICGSKKINVLLLTTAPIQMVTV